MYMLCGRCGYGSDNLKYVFIVGNLNLTNVWRHITIIIFFFETCNVLMYI